MKKFKYYHIILSLFLLFIFICEVTAGGEKIEETFYQQLIRAVVRIEEHRSICVPGIAWAVEKNIPIGTAFFIQDKYNGITKFFIITARHVIEKKNDLFARVKISSKSNEYVVLLLPRNLWVLHPSQTKKGYFPVDVAVMQIQPTNFIKAFLFCENEKDCGKDDKDKPKKNQLNESPNLVFDSCRYTKLEKPCQSRDTAVPSKWRSAYKIRG